MEKSILDNDYFLFNDNNEKNAIENLIKCINPYFGIANYYKDKIASDIQEQLEPPIVIDRITNKQYYLLVHGDKVNFEEVGT